MLTDKQERFAQLVFQGYDQSEAKRLAYPECKLTGNALYVNASRLANLAKVRLRVDKLRNAAVTPLIADIVERKSHATSIMRNPNVRIRDQLAASKLLGEYEGDFVVRTENTSQSLNANIADIPHIKLPGPRQRTIFD